MADMQRLLRRADRKGKAEMVIPVIEARTEEQRRHLRGMSDKGARRAVRRAMNKTLNKAFTVAKRAIAERRNLKVSVVARDLKKIRAGATKPVAEIRARGKSFSAFSLKGRVTQTKAGTKVTSSKGNRELYEGAFIAVMPNGKRGVFETRGHAKHRKIEKGGRVYWSELPIAEIRFPTVASTLLQDEVQAQIQAVVDREFPIELDRAIRLEEKKFTR